MEFNSRRHEIHAIIGEVFSYLMTKTDECAGRILLLGKSSALEKLENYITRTLRLNAPEIYILAFIFSIKENSLDSLETKQRLLNIKYTFLLHR